MAEVFRDSGQIVQRHPGSICLRLAATKGIAGTFAEIVDLRGPLMIGGQSRVFGQTARFEICGIFDFFALELISRKNIVSTEITAWQRI